MGTFIHTSADGNMRMFIYDAAGKVHAGAINDLCIFGTQPFSYTDDLPVADEYIGLFKNAPASLVHTVVLVISQDFGSGCV